MQPRAAPPGAYHGTSLCLGYSNALLLAGVVVMVSVAVAAAVPLMVTGLVEPKLSVGRSEAPVGLAVTAALKATLPVNPATGVTAIVEVFPVVAPGARVTAAPEMVRLGGAAVVTVTELPVTSGS
jgi:hypothetical protein